MSKRSGPRARGWWGLLLGLALLAGACGDSDDGDGTAPAVSADVSDGAGGAESPDSSDASDTGGAGTSGGTTDEGPDTSDAAAIVGQTTLPEDVEELLDDIDDIVSLGDCQSELVGLGMPAPDGWACRVMDNPIGDMDGFTLFTDGNQLNITIGTPSDLPSPCEVLSVCGDATPIALSDNFPDTMQIELVGTVTIWGTYKDSDAELLITSLEPLSPEQVQFVSDVLDSVVPLS